MKQKLNCILLIDDDEPTNFIHRIVLEEVGCSNEILVRDDAKEALETIKTRHLQDEPLPDLIFLDINMPGMNGWQFLEAYQQLPLFLQKGIIIVMLTTSQNPDDRRKTLTLNIVASFLTKPLTHDLVRSVLKEFFPEKM